mmetsp:Transcript_45938/g.139507  ORF Transcript_45938/g.139507 Transcript_45938/m.139507 type:complete len:97 (-) Transcript_45938:1463-1753(-)
MLTEIYAELLDSMTMRAQGGRYSIMPRGEGTASNGPLSRYCIDFFDYRYHGMHFVDILCAKDLTAWETSKYVADVMLRRVSVQNPRSLDTSYLSQK